MKCIKQFTLAMILILVGYVGSTQSVNEIINNYFENTGGLDKWKALKGVKMNAVLNQQGMELPIEIVRMSDGRTYTRIDVQGMKIYQNVYDGTTLWSTNFQSMKPEKANEEATANFKLDLNDFPDPFVNYKDKNYQVELVGTEKIEGTDTYKVKLVREPKTYDGIKRDDISYFYFDAENFVIIAQESEVMEGPMKGSIGWNTLSDYDEVDGLYFSFSFTQGLKDGPSQPITFTSIEVNPVVEDSVFKFIE